MSSLHIFLIKPNITEAGAGAVVLHLVIFIVSFLCWIDLVAVIDFVDSLVPDISSPVDYHNVDYHNVENLSQCCCDI